jgi:hypothetical protein
LAKYASIVERREKSMKITLDLDTCEITVPKNFFVKVEKENEIITKHNGEAVSATDRIKKAFETAMSNTDKYLRTKA